MMYRSFITLIGAGLVALVGAKSIDIDVGEDGNFKFNPDTSTAAVGDT
jgi:plastocyanin